MNSYKSFLFTLVVVIAGMCYLKLNNSGHADDPTASAPAITAESVRQIAEHDSFRTQAASADSRQRDNSNASREPTVNTAAEVEHNWHLRLYPELDRIMQLEDLPSDAAQFELVDLLSNQDAVVRLAALESLANMEHPALASLLAPALDDPNAQIRVAALQALATRDDDSAWTYIEPSLYDSDPEVRIAAIEALAVLESEQALPTLAGLLSDRNLSVRRHAVNALGEIGGDSAIYYLQQARYDADQGIRSNADAILDEIQPGEVY